MISYQDNHALRLAKMAPALTEIAAADEIEAGARAIAKDAAFSIIDGAISGSGHVPSLPGEAPNADTHDLDQSIHATPATIIGNTITANAVADSDHAFIELGTSKMEPRPYMGPASRRLHDQIIRSLAQRLRDERQ